LSARNFPGEIFSEDGIARKKGDFTHEDLSMEEFFG